MAFLQTAQAHQYFKGFSGIHAARAEAAKATGRSAQTKASSNEYLSADGTVHAVAGGYGVGASVSITKRDADYRAKYASYQKTTAVLRALELRVAGARGSQRGTPAVPAGRAAGHAGQKPQARALRRGCGR
jgi:hypothetical protein